MKLDASLAPSALVALLAAALAASSGCSTAAEETGVVRVGYFANLTHAPALLAIEKGFFADAFGPGVTLETRVFGAGPEAVEALFSDALDIAYIGPNPAINAFAQSHGEAIRIIAGATSGGAALVVAPTITTPAQLRGAKIATPQLGNTQDVALRAWLARQGLSANLEGGGDVSIVPQANAQTLETFRTGVVQGAWVPEPWSTRLVLEGGASVLVDERSLWPDGKFVTTHVIVRAKFLEEQPERVEQFLRAHLRAVDFVNAEPAEARQLVDAAIGRLSGKALPAAVVERAWANLTFTVDPIASSLAASAEHATAVGLLEPVKLEGIYDLAPLNATLAAAGRPPIATGGL